MVFLAMKIGYVWATSRDISSKREWRNISIPYINTTDSRSIGEYRNTHTLVQTKRDSASSLEYRIEWQGNYCTGRNVEWIGYGLIWGRSSIPVFTWRKPTKTLIHGSQSLSQALDPGSPG
jgi:hypothetical protein